jgi:hypothetical protein
MEKYHIYESDVAGYDLRLFEDKLVAITQEMPSYKWINFNPRLFIYNSI